MSTLAFEDLTIESSIGQSKFFTNATHLILELSFNGRDRGEIELVAQQPPCELWKAGAVVETNGYPTYLLLSVWMKLDGNGHRMLLGFKGLKGREIYQATGSQYETPLTCHQNYPTFTLKTKITSKENVQESTLEKGKRSGSAIQEMLDTAFDASHRFDRYGDLASMEQAISNYQNVLGMISKNDPSRTAILSNLGACFGRRFRRLGDLNDLNDAVACLEEAVNSASDTQPSKPSQLMNLGSSLVDRFARLGNAADIDNAIGRYQAAVNLASGRDSERCHGMAGLGDALRVRFQRFGNISDIDNAIVQLETAVDLTPDADDTKHSNLRNLGTALQLRFRRLGNDTDIDNAIKRLEAALALTPEGHPEAPEHLNSLGMAFYHRFEWFGNVVDIDNAIARLGASVDLTPDRDSRKPTFLINLGTCLQDRYNRLGDLADLNNTIARQQAAVDLMPNDDPHKHSGLNNLSIALERRFLRLGNVADIDKSIALQQAAVDLTPEGYLEKVGRLNNLGGAYAIRFERLGNISDLHNAIEQQQLAVDLTPEGHPRMHTRLTSLGSSLDRRFRQLGNRVDIENSISLLQKAVELTPEGHPSKITNLIQLGISFTNRGRYLKRIEDVESAISCTSAAALSSFGAPDSRLLAAEEWVAGAALIKHPTLLDAYDCLLGLIPFVAWLGLSIPDRHRQLLDMGEYTRDAAAAAISLGRYEKALEWLEQGRSVVWTQILHLRTPVDRLRDANAELADRLLDISQQLDRGIPQDDSHDRGKGTMEEEGRRYRALTTEWETTIKQIRSLPSFEDFVKPSSANQLMKAARQGPVIVLNIAKERCDALAIKSGSEDIVHIPFPNVTFSRITELRDELKDSLYSNGIRLRGERAAQRMTDDNIDKDCQHLLEELWNSLVKPVIDSLDLSPHPNTLPHIWWCVTGPLAFLPIHAAGIYDTNSIDSTLSEYAISSYIPTVSSLLEGPAPETEPNFKLLSVIQPSAPGASPIPNTKQELEYIRRHFTDQELVILEGHEGTKQQVTKEMERCNWLHLACHGIQRSDEPTRSALILEDGHLTLEEIIKLDLPKAELAFLSACQTTTGDEKLSEEAVHIAGGMLLAGYRGVVATMWSIRDELAPEVSNEFYSHLVKEENRPDYKKAAEALHISVQKLRRRAGVSLTDWIPFVHLGF